MRFSIAGRPFDLSSDQVRSRLVGHVPEPIQTHWVEVDGLKWPPKQVLAAATLLDRSEFISHRANLILRALGFKTSALPQEAALASKTPAAAGVEIAPSDPPQTKPPASILDLAAAARTLDRFLGDQDLTTRLAVLEAALLNKSRLSTSEVVGKAGVTIETLAAALTVRRRLGRVSDVIHATVISLALPLILEDGEIITNRPSLAAGNDPRRPFDLETNVRVAEFKVSVWKGADAMRKRSAFKDVVALALEESARRPQLFIVGTEPTDFLKITKSKVAWGLSRGSDHLRERVTARWGAAALTMPIPDFIKVHAARVEVHDLNGLIPGLEGLIGSDD